MKKIFSLALATVLLLETAPALAITSRGACAIDVATGEAVYEYNADLASAPASMTKFMTVYIVYDKMREGVLNKDTLITCSKAAASFSKNGYASNIPLTAGTQYSVDELIGAALVPSACSAAYLMAEYIAGSQEKFVDMMNFYVYKLGLEAFYADSTGLSNQNRITARSMAKLARAAVSEFPDILNYTSQPSITFRGTKYKNTNNLLPGRIYAYKGADGLKTGTTSLAGYCITATAERDGTRVVAVTMDSSSATSRYQDIRDILDSAFSNAEKLRKKVVADTTKMYIDGYEIPSQYVTGENPETVIFAEHLENFGFSIDYNAQTRTVHLSKNAGQPYNTMNTSDFDSFCAKVIENSSLKVILTDGDTAYTFDKVYDLSGYAAIPTSELEKLYEYSWNTEQMSGYFCTNRD